eukprot:162545_1
MQMHNIHSSNDSFLILYHDHQSETRMVTILSYDHQRNEFNKLSDSLLIEHSQFWPASVIDPTNRIVHVFDWAYHATRHLQFNIKSKKWNHIDVPSVIHYKIT